VVKEGDTAYGFGWNVTGEGDGKSIWHTGKTAGYRAFLGRRLKDRSTIILLTNQGDSKRMEISQALLHLLSDEPYALPKRSGAEKIYAMIHQSGIQEAMRWADSQTERKDSEYDFNEGELNGLGYELLYGENRTGDAMGVFQWNADAHPGSSNAFDSLAEAYRKKGDKSQAIRYYQKAVELDPTNLHAVAMLKELR
jgi:tetratricopeptide (TPR) repeat protein